MLILQFSLLHISVEFSIYMHTINIYKYMEHIASSFFLFQLFSINNKMFYMIF